MWKTYIGRCIYESPSGFQVWQNIGYRWLTFDDNVYQTLINRHYPGRGGLEYIEPLTRMVHAFPGDCCLLGLGGASVAHALFPALAHVLIDAVENNLEVINIATRYFKIARVQNLNIIHQNAEDFIQITASVYQHLLVDLYHSESYPAECNNEDFFAHCKARLLPEGIMAVNLINIHEKLELFQYIRHQFNHCTLLVPVKGTSNTIVFAFNMPNSHLFLEKIQSIRLMDKLFWDSVWGCVGQFKMY